MAGPGSPPHSQISTDDHDSVLHPIIEDLCKPIKDLRKNFDVNIRENLGKYMDEIHDIVEVNGKKMNFSQAAMMIQGSVGCYSRKVDFLHQYSMKTLNMIGKDKDAADGDGDAEGGGIRRRRGDGRLGTGTDFAFLDIQIDKNTQKKKKESNLDIMMKNLNFIQVTPREFIEKEGLDVGGSKIEIFHGNNFEMLGYKRDFKMSAQFSMATATFGDRLYVKEQGDLGSVKRGLDETIVNENYHSFIDQHQDNEVHVDNADAEVSFHGAAAQDNISYNDVYMDNEDGGNDDVFEEMEPEIAAPAPQQIADRLRDCVLNAVDINRNRFVQTDADKAAEMWGSENLFDDNEDKKPVKKSKIVRLPARLKPKKGKKAVVQDENLPAISMFVQASMDRFVSKKHPMLSHEIYVEQERQKEYLRMVKKNIKNIQLNNGMDLEEEGGGGVDYDEGAADHHDDVPLDPGVEQEDDLEDFEPLPPFQAADPHAGIEHLGDVDDGGDHMSQTNHRASDHNSYEELVSKMVAEFVQRSQAWIASTDMARKVQSWHKMINPRLQAVEQRKAFDIHKYGSNILGCFQQHQQEQETLGFHQVIKNKPKEEVSRYFLASLMLANCHNIEIGSQGEINDMKIRFLSTERHHEQLHEFQAASQQI